MAEASNALNPVQVRYSDDRFAVYITVNPREVLQGHLSFEEIMEALLESGFSSSEYHLEDHIVEELMRINWERLNKVMVRRVAYRVEANLRLRIAPDAMEAWITLEPAYPGECPDRERLYERLQHQGITQGILEDMVELACEVGDVSDLPIAQGSLPIDGEDAILTFLLADTDPSGWQDTPTERLHKLPHVEAGTPLMRRTPPTPGQAGWKVTGECLPPRPGLDIPLSPALGTALAPDDPNLLVATQAGRPVPLFQSVRVDTVHTLAAVGGDTPICLADSLVVIGDVAPGSHLDVAGDVDILGNVEAATLQIGGNLYVHGHIKAQHSHLQISGHLRARSAEYAVIACGGNFEIATVLRHCNVRVNGNAQIGTLEGGRLRLLGHLQAHTIGSPAHPTTRVELGLSDGFEEHLFRLERAILLTRRQLDETLRTLIQARTGAAPLSPEHLTERRRHLQMRMDSLRSELHRLRQLLVHEQKGDPVSVQGRIYPGFFLKQGDTEEHVGEMREGGYFSAAKRHLSP
jgi:uncharacterized protein (DUF342 family)